MILDLPYLVESVENDLEKYDLPIVLLKRDDGVAGWMKITGPGAEELRPGHRYAVTSYEFGPPPKGGTE